MTLVRANTRNRLCLLLATLLFVAPDISAARGVRLRQLQRHESVFSYVKRVNHGRFSQRLYQQVVGAAAVFKEGDRMVGVSATNRISRRYARRLLSNTKIKDIHEAPLYKDALQQSAWDAVDAKAYTKVRAWTLGQLRTFLLSKPEAQIKSIMTGLNSDVIASVVKLMSNKELTRIGQTVFNNLPGTKIGAKGYCSARIQPNSPTDNPQDIQWQVFNAWSFGVGDLMLGNNPSASDAKTLRSTESTLKGLVTSFKLEKVLPWSVLAHIDDQAKLEKAKPKSTALWFQSIAGSESAGATFGISTAKMKR
ncbi:MAG: ethanolamine ammonia-lyase subunit EutB, partial [Deltaproteobacteria bacterium]|nr:ethanolamine ammonia-lyase subunit EutB [Deltaproteobacteria bacterium]